MTRTQVLAESLIQQGSLTARNLEHPLRGNCKGCREAHVEFDSHLIHRIVGNELRLVRTGLHADLFDE